MTSKKINKKASDNLGKELEKSTVKSDMESKTESLLAAADPDSRSFAQFEKNKGVDFLIQDLVEASVIALLAVIVWLFGRTWYFWPFWVVVGCLFMILFHSVRLGFFPFIRRIRQGISFLLGPIEDRYRKHLHVGIRKILMEPDISQKVKKENKQKKIVKSASKK